MAYIRPGGARALSPETVALLGSVLGLSLPPEDLVPLGSMLADQLASIAALDRLDLTNVDPIARFDPRWHERTAPRPLSS